MNIDQLREELIIDEGKRLDVYNCTASKATVGIGHMIRDADPESSLAVGDTITEERCQELFENDIQVTLSDCQDIFLTWEQQPEEVQLILANMCFQLGRPRLSRFKKMIAAIESYPPQYDRAADEMHNSRWQKQTPNRANRLIARMREIET